MYVCMYVGMYICMYVCMYVFRGSVDGALPNVFLGLCVQLSAAFLRSRNNSFLRIRSLSERIWISTSSPSEL